MSNYFKKIFFIIPKKLQSKIYFFLVINFLSILFEMLGIVLIIPLVSLIFSLDIFYDYPILSNVFNLLGKPSQEMMLVFLGFFIVIIFLIKNLVLLYFIWWQTNFAHNIQYLTSKSLFNIYLNKEYSFHLSNNSSKLIRNTGLESNNVRTAILGLMTLITEIFLIIGIVSILIFYNPVINSIVIITFVIFVSLFYFLTKNKILEWGKIRLSQTAATIKGLNQAFQGIKDIKVFKRETYFLDFYTNNLNQLVKMNILNGFIKGIPKLFLEFLGIVVLICLLAILFVNKIYSSEEIMTSLSLFAVSIIKILPSFSKVLASAQAIKYNYPSVDLVFQEFTNNKNYKNLNKSNKIEFLEKKDDNLFIIQDLNFKYNTKSSGLNKINFRVKQNEIIGIIGESGSGKSTLINIILGLLKPDDGIIKFNGVEIKENLDSWRSKIGYIPQNIYLMDDSIKNNIAFGINDHEIDLNRVNECIELAELNSLVNNLKDGINSIVGERGVKISGGELQRIGIARALYKNPNILILDEATSALDINTEKNILKTILSLKKNRMIIVVSHRKSIFEFCKKIYEMNNGYVKLKSND